MSDSTAAVPPEGPGTFLDGSEPVTDGEDVVDHGSQTLLPSDLEEPALLNGTSGGAEDADPDA